MSAVSSLHLHTVEAPMTETEEIYRLGCFLLAREKLAIRPVRLFGIAESGLGEPVGKQSA